MTVQLIRGNALELPLDDNSVDIAITSPPYFALRAYEDGGESYEGQIGNEATPAEFIDALIAVTRELMRVVKPVGSIWVNLGDKYATAVGQGNGVPGGSSSLHGRERLATVYANTDGMRTGASAPGVRAKSLIGVPWRYAIRCIDELGLILRAEVVWSKPNGLPESVTDRVRRNHETWFHFVQQPRYFQAVDYIREDYTAPPFSGQNSHDAKAAGATRNPAVGTWDARGYNHNSLGKLPGSVWSIATQPLKVPKHVGVDHFAAFPMEWPRRLILGWSPSGICTECGEGRRPIAEDGDAYRAYRASVGDFNAQNRNGPNGYIGSAGAKHAVSAHLVPERERQIIGEVCACTPYTDHEGTGEPHANGKRNGDIDVASRGSNLGAAPRVGPWREWHFDQWTPAPTRPTVVLDPFGGTGTTALVAHALGRHGISVDMSADYCRLAEWRTSDPGELAAALQVDRPKRPAEGQDSLLELL